MRSDRQAYTAREARLNDLVQLQFSGKLVMLSEHDHGTPPEMAQQIHANLPGSELKFIPSAAHPSNIEQAKIFNDALGGFLRRAGTTPE